MPKPQPWYASLNQPPRSPKDGRNRRANTATHRRSTDRTNSGVDPGSQDTTTFTIANWTTIPWNLTEPKPPEIPYAGVRAGELIGHRMWLVLPDYNLCSIAHYLEWQPEATIEGKLDESVSGMSLFKTLFGGVYSYNAYAHLAHDLEEITPNSFPCTSWVGSYIMEVIGIAIGTIKCWGEVIEHEKGWRAQYAKLQSIDYVVGAVDINILRERYKV